MTVYPEKAACFNGYDGDRALELAALASNPANKDDAIDRTVYQAYSKARGKDVDQAARDLADLYTTEKYYGFNPVVKRTVADVVEKASGKGKGIAAPRFRKPERGIPHRFYAFCKVHDPVTR